MNDRLDLTPEDLLTTTRTVRKRLDLDRPVERSLVEKCLRLAFSSTQRLESADLAVDLH
jgi:hypothetical protein